MIAILCAMPEELQEILLLFKNVAIKKGPKILYNKDYLNNDYYFGTLGKTEVVATLSGVAGVYSVISTVKMIENVQPECIINIGCAGSLSEEVRIGDTVIASKAALWRTDVPEAHWKRDFDNRRFSFPCLNKILENLSEDKHIKFGPVVSADEFIHTGPQLVEVKTYYTEALCADMESASIAATCYALNTPLIVARTITDMIVKDGNHDDYELNLEEACKISADVCRRIIYLLENRESK